MATATHEGADFDGTIEGATEELFRRYTTTDANEPSDEDGTNDNEDDTDHEEAEEDGDDRSGPDSDDDGDEGSEDADERDSERETDEGEDGDDAGEAEGDEGKAKTVIDSEDAVVKIKVDGKEVEASIKDLKRLYGQEAALTRKSQEAAEIRKRSEEAGALHVAGLEAMLQRARDQYRPYENLNFLALAKDPSISGEELSALADAAKAAHDNVRFIETELDGVVRYTQAQRHQMMIAQAKETHKLLSDPKQGIAGWSEPLYNEIRSFAVEQGLPSAVVDEIVDPVGIKLLHMAMSYAKGKQAITKGGTKKVDKSPKKIVKGAPAETVQKNRGNSKTNAFKNLERSGTTDAAAEALLARWSNS